MVMSLSAKGLTHGEITAHLTEVYGASVSKSTITTITVLEGMAEWQNRPLELRLALATTIAFLGVNGRRLAFSNDEAYHFIIAVAVGELDDVLIRCRGTRNVPSRTPAAPASRQPASRHPQTAVRVR
jgi:hypothetical protein